MTLERQKAPEGDSVAQCPVVGIIPGIKPTKIPLRNRSGQVVAYAVVDPERYQEFMERRWHLYRGYAAHTLRNGSKLLMHREVVGVTSRDGSEVHHENENRLDNRRSNLAVTTKAKHRHLHAGHGKSGLRGVRPSRSGGRWMARVKHNGQATHLGTFDTPVEASAVVESWWSEQEAT